MQWRFDGGVMNAVSITVTYMQYRNFNIMGVCCLIPLHEHVWMQVSVLILLHAMEVWWRGHAVSTTITYMQCQNFSIMGVLFNTITWTCVYESDCTITITCNSSLMEGSCSQYYYCIHAIPKFPTSWTCCLILLHESSQRAHSSINTISTLKRTCLLWTGPVQCCRCVELDLYCNNI
jgi:hypothetical protein